MNFIKLEADCGENINRFAKRLIDEFNQLKQKNTNTSIQVNGIFNDIILVIDAETTIDTIVQNYFNQVRENTKKYEQSDEYKEKEKQRKEEITKLQLEANAKMEDFKNMDKTNIDSLIQWLYDFQKYSDRIGVNTDSILIINELKSFGYYSNMNCGNNFIEADKINFAGYIVGQCISSLENYNVIHQVILGFIEKWQNQFIKK